MSKLKMPPGCVDVTACGYARKRSQGSYLPRCGRSRERPYVQDHDVERARTRAGGLLTNPKHWILVERVAAELLNKKTLTGAEIDALVAFR